MNINISIFILFTSDSGWRERIMFNKDITSMETYHRRKLKILIRFCTQNIKHLPT